MRVSAALLCAGANAFSVAPLQHRGVALRTITAPIMLDGFVEALPGIGLLAGFTAVGAGAIYFVEKAGEATIERGDTMSEESMSRMAGKFMEDEVLVTNLDDTITKMEAALAEAEGREVDTSDGLTEVEREELRDDWDA